jgi:HlyD family secretion protein
VDLNALSIDRDRRRTRRRRWPLWPFLLLGLAVVGLLFRGPLGAALAGLTAPTVRLAPLERVDPRAQGALSGAAANGYVVAARRAALSADTPGRIVELRVTEGSELAAGDLVARLYAEEYRAALQRAAAEVEVAEASIAAAERDVDRARAEFAAEEADLPRRDADAEAALAEVEAARARLTLAELELSRSETLAQERVASQRELDQARATIDEGRAALAAAEATARSVEAAAQSARAALGVRQAAIASAEAELTTARARAQAARAAAAQAQATLDKTEVRAPFDGIVVLKDAEVGEVVSPNSQGGSNARGSVATMVDRASLEVQAEVPEATLSVVEVGAPARIFLDAYPDQPYAGTVDRIWPTADRQKATVEVRVRFAAPDERLRPEMGVRVVFLDADDIEALAAAERGEPAPLLLPDGALVEREGSSGVFTVEERRAVFRPLTLGGERGGRTVVLGGLDEGARFVLDPPADLAPGDRVRAEEEP